MTNKQTKGLRLTEKALETLINVKQASFKCLRPFTNHNLASGIVELVINNSVNKKVAKLLLDFFEVQRQAKRTDRVKTLSIQTIGKAHVVKYRALHGFQYAWSDDLENAFTDWLLSTYSVSKTSKTYKALTIGRSLMSFH